METTVLCYPVKDFSPGKFLSVKLMDCRDLPKFISARKEHPEDSWIKKHIFPGSMVPSLREIIQQSAEYSFYVLDVESLRRHYNRTLRCWDKNFNEHRAGNSGGWCGRRDCWLPEVPGAGCPEREGWGRFFCGSFPALFRENHRFFRSNRGTPSSVSSRWMDWLRAGWAM